jgi:hypothetical protein
MLVVFKQPRTESNAERRLDLFTEAISIGSLRCVRTLLLCNERGWGKERGQSFQSGEQFRLPAAFPPIPIRLADGIRYQLAHVLGRKLLDWKNVSACGGILKKKIGLLLLYSPPDVPDIGYGAAAELPSQNIQNAVGRNGNCVHVGMVDTATARPFTSNPVFKENAPTVHPTVCRPYTKDDSLEFVEPLAMKIRQGAIMSRWSYQHVVAHDLPETGENAKVKSLKDAMGS